MDKKRVSIEVTETELTALLDGLNSELFANNKELLEDEY